MGRGTRARGGRSEWRVIALRSAAVIVLAMSAPGCAVNSSEVPPATSPASPSSNGRVAAGHSTELTMDMHGTQTWSDAGVTVTLTDVPADSRCPAGTNCVSAGNASVELMVAVDGRSETFSLRYGLAGGSSDLLPDRVDRFGFRFEVTRLDPQPTAGRTIDPLTYRASVRITAL